MGGNIPGGNFLCRNFPGEIFQGVWWVRIFWVGIFSGEIVLEPSLTHFFFYYTHVIKFFFLEMLHLFVI